MKIGSKQSLLKFLMKLSVKLESRAIYSLMSMNLAVLILLKAHSLMKILVTLKMKVWKIEKCFLKSMKN